MGSYLSSRGVSKLVVVMAIVTLALFGAIVIPAVTNSYENRLEKRDGDYITAAQRMADYTDFGDKELMVYDGIEKVFVKPSEVSELEHYALSGQHEGDFVVALIDESGRKKCRWMSVQEIKKRLK